MWNKPHLMKEVSDLLFVAGAAGLLFAGAVWAARMQFFPLREVVVAHELHAVKRAEFKRALSGRLSGNFFSVNLEALRHALEQLPWVRKAEVRRQWPGRLEVSLEEHVPAAFWGQATGQLVNTHGEVFTASLQTLPATPMPVLTGPAGLSVEMLGYYRQAVEILRPLGRTPQSLTISPRLAVQLRLDDGMLVELGREQAKSPVRLRLERFVEYYPSVLGAGRQKPTVVDMRYPNGFALHLAAATPGSEKKGKP